MKKIFCLLMILVAGLMIISCQKNPAEIPPDGGKEIGGSADTTVEATGIPAVGDEAGGSATVGFYLPEGAGEQQPQFLLYVNPGIGDEPSQASVNCDGMESDIYTPTTGIWMDNHCIITVGQNKVTVLLPDGSRIYFDVGSIFQVNISEEITEIILAQGEVYSIVSPQSEGEKFIITAGDTSVEAVGTQYGVSLKEELINVVVIDGMVYTHRCHHWKDHTCMQWTQVSSEMAVGSGYSSRIGEDNWSSIKLETPADWASSDSFNMPLSSPEVDIVWWFGGTTHQEYLDDSIYLTESWMIGELMRQDISYVWYDQKASQANAGTAFCANHPQSCPVAEIQITATPVEGSANPSMSGSGPSGKFPEFDRGSCFTRDGHLWCFPVAGSVDVSMSGEWDLTAICAQYPGETFCSW